MSNPRTPLPFPGRHSDAHKGDFGRVLMIGGSRGMAGSIAMSSIAALKTGSGLVSVAVPDRCLETVAAFHPGIMTIPLADDERGQFDLGAALPKLAAYDVVGCGPGMRTGAGAVRIVESLLRHHNTFRVLDADAINVLSSHQMLKSPALPRDQSRLVLTPHPGELARLTGAPSNDREQQIDAAAELARVHGLTVVVKGGPTVVVSLSQGDASKPPAIQRYVNTTGNPGMATAGSGDILTGVIASLLGQGLDASQAARLGVFLHGVAGDLGAQAASQAGLTCTDILAHLPAAIASI